MSEGLTINQLAEQNALLVTENAALQQKLDALAAENAALKDYLKECAVVQGEGNWTSDSEKSVYVPAVEWAPPTPATNAYLNAVRADVLLQFFNEQMEWALVNWQWSNFTSLEKAAIREGDCELSGVILMLKKIADFENELRAAAPKGDSE